MGRVGASIAFTLVAKGLVDELILANRTLARATGEAKDLLHASAFVQRPLRIRAGWLEATSDSDVVVMCASKGVRQQVQSRLELATDNAQLFDELIPEIAARSPQAILLVVTNPVDAMTFQALRLSGFASQRVMGTGTLIDSARYRSLLSAEVGIHPDDIRAYILGEHGDTQFAANSLAWTGGERLHDDATTRRIFEETVRTGYDVYQAKGYTNHAIALAVALVVESIGRDECRTMPLSVLMDGFLGERDVCLSVPVVVGRAGIVRQLCPELSKQEQAAFHASARAVRRTLSALATPLRERN